MEESIYNIFNISAGEIHDYFEKLKSEAVVGKIINGDLVSKRIDEFIDTHMSNTCIDELPFYHLTRRLRYSVNNCEGKNLFELLTTKNEYSLFLKKHEITFKLNSNKLDLFYNGRLIDLTNTDDIKINYLRGRLGHDSIKGDYTFNGLMFKDSILEHYYGQILKQGSEFLIMLSQFLNDQDLVTNFYNDSDYYCFKYIIPIDMVIFDEQEESFIESNQHYLLKEVLTWLFEYYRGKENIAPNLQSTLRLKDNYNLEEKYYESKEIIT